MGLDYSIGLFVAVFLLGYLVYFLIHISST